MMKKNWEIKKLGDVCEINIGRTPERGNSKMWDKEKKTENVWLSIADLNNTKNGYISDSTEYVSDNAVPKMKLVKANTLLMSFKLTIGRCAITKRDLFTNEAIAALPILDKNLNLFFLKYYLENFDWAKLTEGDVKVKGKTLNKEKLKEVPITLPPLEEQKRIVKILDEKFAQLETIKVNAQTNLQNAKDLFQSQLTKAFSNTTWEKKKVSEISENLDSKRIPITKNVRKTGQYPYYGASGIVDYVEDYIFDGKFLLVSEDGANLLARTYPIAFIAEGKFWVNNHAHILSFKDEITMKFVELFFSNLDISPYVTGMAQPKFNQASLNNIEIPLPPLSEQKRIVEELDALSEKVKALCTIYEKQIADCDELKQAYLQKAFEGEL